MALRLSEQRLEEIKNIVVDMYEKYNISCAPISGFEIATKMGIKVIPYSAYKLKHRYRAIKESRKYFKERNANQTRTKDTRRFD